MIGVPKIKIANTPRKPLDTVVGSDVVAAQVIANAATHTATGKMRSGGATSSKLAGIATENVVIASARAPAARSPTPSSSRRSMRKRKLAATNTSSEPIEALVDA